MRKLVFLLVWVILLLSGCGSSSGADLPTSAAPDPEVILQMEDPELYDALIMRFMAADPNELNQKQLTVAAVITFDAEMMNGGLCQFFVNDYSGYAQYVSDALGEVGAVELQKHYSDFLDQNEIDVAHMDSFRIASTADYLNQLDRFPYEAFDNAFSEIYQRENTGALLLSYARLHAEEIFD